MFGSIHLWAILIAALLGFFVGALWYSKRMFGHTWLQEVGLTQEQCKAKSHNKLVFVYSFLCSLVAVFVLACFLGPHPGFFYAVGFSLVISIAWIATAMSINDMFAGRSRRLFLIDAGYHVARFLIYGIVLGLIH